MEQDKLLRAIVRIHAYGRPVDMEKPFVTLDRFKAVGTGFFIQATDSDLYVLTCSHVVEGADSVTVVLPLLGGTEHKASILSLAPDYDLAVLVMDILPETHILPMGASSALKLRQTLTAVGYPLGQTALKVSDGVYAGFQGALQHTVSISPGNSGGPLINDDGEVVGVNSSGVMEASNVGYAVPIEVFKNMRDRMFVSEGRGPPAPGRVVHMPVYGIEYAPITKFHSHAVGADLCGGEGVQIVTVIPGSSMHEAGVRAGDILTSFDKMSVSSIGEVKVPWNYQKVSLRDVFRRSTQGHFEVGVWKADTRACVTVRVNPRPNTHVAMRTIYPPHDEVPYIVVAGLVIMPLIKNHETCPRIAKMYACKDASDLAKPSLVISHVLNGTLAHIEGGMYVGDEVCEVNEIPANTLNDVRAALVKCTTVDGHLMMSFKTPKGKKLVLSALDVLCAEERASKEHLYVPEPVLVEYLSLRR